MRSLLREPLLHFFVLGALLFVLYGWLNQGPSRATNEIVVSQAQLSSLSDQFARLWQRPPTQAELEGLVEGWVKEEVLYREGVAMRLDRDDPIVRRRVAQKVEFLGDIAASAPPTDAQLQVWLDAHAADYRIEPRYTLRQVYFDPIRRGVSIDAQLATALESLQNGAAVEGDATLLPAQLDDAPAFEVARVFGNEFAGALNDVALGSWQGPLPSGFGAHLVLVSARADGRPATLDEARAAVERDFLHDRNTATNAAFYEQMRANYRLRIETAAITATDAR